MTNLKNAAEFTTSACYADRSRDCDNQHIRHSRYDSNAFFRMKWVNSFISIIYVLASLASQPTLASSHSFNVHDKASLQRGAKLFMNYCSGCHSLKYLHYNHLAEGLGLLRFAGHTGEDLLKNNLIFTQSSINDPIRIALPPEDAKQWFGVVPPDLSLIAREKGTDWLYTYLSSFYKDDSRPFGTNNRLISDVAMPNVLESLHDDLSESQLDTSLQDLVTFLAYTGDPTKLVRYRIGFFVIGFLFVLFIVILNLKIVYWREIDIK